MKKINFVVYGKPRGKQRPRVNTYTRIAYTPKETVEYEKKTRIAVLQSIDQKTILKKPLYAKITAYFEIPKSYTKKKIKELEEMNYEYTKKPDGDNIIKMILDAMNGIVYEDDSEFSKIEINKKYAIDGNERVEVEIGELL